MRLCDEYHERIGLDPLVLRHSSRSFLFFEGGRKLLSVKWVDVGGSSGRYEFRECVLGKIVIIDNKKDVEWNGFESHLSEWVGSHGGFVFCKNRVFSLVWEFFVKSNDRFLSQNYNPLLIYSTLGDSEKSVSSARKMAGEISSLGHKASYFWKNKSSVVLENYAYWLEMRR